jgi:hypothetical protein
MDRIQILKQPARQNGLYVLQLSGMAEVSVRTASLSPKFAANSISRIQIPTAWAFF